MQSKFSKSTDTVHKEKLESSIAYANWLAGAAHGGSEVGFEVKTVFVGEGAAIKIKGKSDKGKSLGKISDVISGNYYVGKMPIPDSIQLGDYVYFEVELPKLGLNETSNRIPAGPPINVTNMKWDKKEARRGDILKLSADITGAAEGAEVKIIIFEYDADGANDKIVEIPTTVKNKKIDLSWEYEYHEDVDDIPTNEELQKYGKSYNPPEYYFVIDVDTLRFGENQESKLLTFKDYIEIELRNEDGELVTNEKYILHLPDGSKRQGQLDGSGHARENNVPPGEIRVEFPNSKDYS
jgi:hypothetical protein